ncbi:hypothetical protein P5673_026888 [Acropora cervicornis]|uniref:Uncharacterized protein n=1 Tax=Acropora cervicornis TaxID=6130 RepID=A0AAD9PZZ2_ACRCE|nr:hypothetical protein P5673_026888 [Acropora cervicornis]
MSINLTKTKELVVRGRSKAPVPTPLPGIEQVDNIKLLGVTFHHSPNNWDSHFDTLLGKAGLLDEGLSQTQGDNLRQFVGSKDH